MGMDVGHGFFSEFGDIFLLFIHPVQTMKVTSAEKLWENVEGIVIEGSWTGYSVVGILMMVPCGILGGRSIRR
jgi:hypothetical protein